MSSEKKLTILLLEDEITLAETLKLSLKKMGFLCLWAKTLKEARKIISQAEVLPALAVLDRTLPDGDGLELLADEAFKNIRVLVLSSRSSLQERVKGLERGADDYLPKPFHWDELKARLMALVRRIETSPASANKTKWQLRPESLQIRTPQGWIELTPLEYKFLAYLIEREDTIVSKERLLREVWGFTLLPKTRTVDYVLTQLRKRIEIEPDAPKHLLTIRGAGVRFLG